MSKEVELKQIQKQLWILHLIDAPGVFLVGMGLYGIFGSDGDAFIDILNNEVVSLASLLVGGVIMTGVMIKQLPLMKRKTELVKADDA